MADRNNPTPDTLLALETLISDMRLINGLAAYLEHAAQLDNVKVIPARLAANWFEKLYTVLGTNMTGGKVLDLAQVDWELVAGLMKGHLP